MRIADKMQFNQVNQNIGKNRSDMSELQNQAATLKRVTKPSDDPLAAARVLTQRTEQKGSEQFLKNINNAKSFLEFSEQALAELSDIYVRAKELAISQANDAGANAQSRQVTAAEIAQLYNQAIQIGNRKLGEKYIFAGYKTQVQPFDQGGNYSGDDGDMKIMTHKDAFIPMNISGAKVFLGKGIGSDGILRSNPEVPKSAEELKQHQQYEIEREHKNNELEKNYIETRGLASIKSGGQNGRNDDSGVDYDNGYGNDGREQNEILNEGINILQTLKGLEVALRANDKQAVQDTLDVLDQAHNQVTLARAELGSRVSVINNTAESLQKSIVDNKVGASQLEDADMFQVVSDIQKTDTTLKATLETSGKLIQPSLLDFLR